MTAIFNLPQNNQDILIHGPGLSDSGLASRLSDLFDGIGLKDAKLIIYAPGEDEDFAVSLGWKILVDGKKYGNFVNLKEIPDSRKEAALLVGILQRNADDSRIKINEVS